MSTAGYRSGAGQITVAPVTDAEVGQLDFAQERFYMLMGDSSFVQTHLLMYDIRWFNEPFSPGGQQSYEMEFEPLAAITPWFDMGFNELSGTLLALSHGGYADTDNTVLVEYQTDFNAAVWTTLGTYPNQVPAQPEINTRTNAVENERTLLFNSLSGVEFRWVRFRFTLQSVGDRRTPNAYPLTVRFIKRPDMRDSIRIAIDVEQTIAARNDIESVDDLWLELKALYDSHEVPQLLAGSVTTWAAIIALPRVLELSDLGDNDIARTTNSNELTIVLNVVELV
ncbi:MAG: hypothetical protein ACSLE3_15700 [Microbacteriaceae bacterium]